MLNLEQIDARIEKLKADIRECQKMKEQHPEDPIIDKHLYYYNGALDYLQKQREQRYGERHE